MNSGDTPARGTLAHWRSMWLPDCREMSRRSSHNLDVPITGSARAGFLLHLLICRHCRRFQKQLFWLRTAVQSSVGQIPSAATLPASARQRLKQSLTLNRSKITPCPGNDAS